MKGITVFNVPIREPEYVEAVLRNMAMEVTEVARAYVEDLEDEYSHEEWALLRYSLQHMITYRPRTCTQEETE